MRDRAAQDGFFQTSVGMAGAIAAQTKPSIAACIDQWYFADEHVIAQRNDEMRQTVAENAGYHPSAIVLAVIQKECGSFK